MTEAQIILGLARPELLEVERRAISVRIAADGIREADPRVLVQPTIGHAPGVLPRPRRWDDFDKRRLQRVWDREMAGTGAEGILGALEEEPA